MIKWIIIALVVGAIFSYGYMVLYTITHRERGEAIAAKHLMLWRNRDNIDDDGGIIRNAFFGWVFLTAAILFASLGGGRLWTLNVSAIIVLVSLILHLRRCTALTNWIEWLVHVLISVILLGVLLWITGKIVIYMESAMVIFRAIVALALLIPIAVLCSKRSNYRDVSERHQRLYGLGALVAYLLVILAVLATLVAVAKQVHLPEEWWAPNRQIEEASDNDGETEVGNAAVENSTVEEDASIREAINNLTVEKVTPEQLEELTVQKYEAVSKELLDSSLSTNDRARTSQTGFSDALTFGFSATDDTERLSELEEEILRNPVYGLTVVNAIKDKKIGDQTIGSFNPWMEEMVKENETVDEEGDYGLSHWLESENKVFYVSNGYRCYAATLCTWLERLVCQGVQARPTIENWCLNASAENNEREGIKALYQYTKDALVFSYVGKDEGAGNGTGDDGSSTNNQKKTDGLFVIGFNIHDKRPEFYGKDTPTTPKVVPEKKSESTTPKTPTPTPEPTPTPSPEPTPTPEPTPKKPAKNPADDPVNNGNAQKGGGDNKATDGAGEVQKEDPRTEKPTGTESDNNHGHSDPATVVPETPPVVPEHKQEEKKEQIVTHEEKMSYEPDPVTDRGPVNEAEAPTASSGDGEFTPED